MKRTQVVCTIALFLVVSTVAGLAVAPALISLAQAPQTVIASPRSNAQVRGVVQVNGSATHPQFQFYKVEYGPEPNPANQWIILGAIHETQVSDGLLERWDTTLVPDGSYSLRLQVVRLDGNFDEYVVRQIIVANAVPEVTATPPDTPTPTETPTPLPPTPTIIIPTPVLPTPIFQPTPTPTRVAATPQGPTPTPSPSPFGVKNLGNSFCIGSAVALGAFLTVGILALFRKLIVALAKWLMRRR